MAELARVAGESSYPFPLLADADLTVIGRWGLLMRDTEHGDLSKPASFLLDADGIVQFAHIGEHPRDRPEAAALLLALRTLTG